MSQPPTTHNTMWDKTKVYSKKGFDKAWDALDKLGGPVNRLSNKLGSEAFWPMTLDKESEKVARILRSFCKDGVYVDEPATQTAPAVSGAEAGKQQQQQNQKHKKEKEKIDGPKGKQKVLKKIPSEVIRDAKGLVIFTAMRTGLWFSGAGGSGVLLARVPETGEWSAPSGILLHTAGLGFLVGADIYDCVMVINTYEALEAFTKVRVTLGSEITVAAGPIGMGGVIESEVHKRRAPIWCYVKSRGFYAGVQIDGTIVIERSDENERFYGRKIAAKEILAGQARTRNPSVGMLTHTIRSAQGDASFDHAPAGVQAPTGPSPSDYAAEDLSNTNMMQTGAPSGQYPPGQAQQYSPGQGPQHNPYQGPPLPPRPGAQFPSDQGAQYHSEQAAPYQPPQGAPYHPSQDPEYQPYPPGEGPQFHQDQAPQNPAAEGTHYHPYHPGQEAQHPPAEGAQYQPYSPAEGSGAQHQYGQEAQHHVPQEAPYYSPTGTQENPKY
ncbi:hypothetical protein BO70DRAFT_365901 [Aspergillus heteromorphus CBS 117.55]|uniref:Ysc84 actin-binding domain-containing protein n=1 Tax=Aspergillus heteromorphus CBS 117.55 TaxID=1448321 RepID=A0A317V6I9_9EURO|nr:uncharacterized protein BO70DRAFT_365901 [Aspergillus heteromorphus CBS 117.55]PWY69089.1 hypothetical protein BO70DRAFT_365901 [Aspergillus heteromorphus CBS 117.55]